MNLIIIIIVNNFVTCNFIFEFDLFLSITKSFDLFSNFFKTLNVHSNKKLRYLFWNDHSLISLNHSKIQFFFKMTMQFVIFVENDSIDVFMINHFRVTSEKFWKILMIWLSIVIIWWISSTHARFQKNCGLNVFKSNNYKLKNLIICCK